MSWIVDCITAAAEETGSSGFGRIRGRDLAESQNRNAFTTKDTKDHKGSQNLNTLEGTEDDRET